MPYALNALSALVGLILIIGAYKRWRWLVDPPTGLWPYYSQALLKRLFGVRGVVVFTYAVGLLIIVASLYGTLIFLIKSGP